MPNAPVSPEVLAPNVERIEGREEYSIPRNRIRLFVGQPREFFDQQALQELAGSIEEVGQIDAIKVKPVFGDPDHEYELIDGERRYRACGIAKKTHMKAIIERGEVAESTFEQFILSVAANFGSAPHTALEKAKAMKRLKEGDPEKNIPGKTVQQIAKICTCSQEMVYQYLRVLDLDPQVHKLMDPTVPAPDRLSMQLAQTLVVLPVERQVEFAQEIVSKKLSVNRARYFIRHKALSLGHKLPKKNPGKDWQKLSGFLIRLAEDFPTYIDMPGRSIADVTVTRTLTEVRALDSYLKQIIEDAKSAREEIAEVIQRKELQQKPRKHVLARGEW